MTSVSFAGKVRIAPWMIPLGVTTAAMGAYMFIIDATWLTGLALITFVSVLPLDLIAWRNRKRPVLEIDVDEIRYAPSPYARLRRVAFDEIEGIKIARWRKATLLLRSGKRMVVNLRHIEGFARERAASALELAVGSAAHPTQAASR